MSFHRSTPVPAGAGCTFSRRAGPGICSRCSMASATLNAAGGLTGEHRTGTIRAMVRILRRGDVERALGMAACIEVVEAAFVAYSSGRAELPGVIHLDVPEAGGEIHVKAGHLHGAPAYAVKVASGFAGGAGPAIDGLVLVFDAKTGAPLAFLLDGGYLTDLRTGAAGGVAARWLAPERVGRVAVVGTGIQARRQVEALRVVRPGGFEVRVWGRDPAKAAAAAEAVGGRAVARIEEAVRDADVVITCTASRAALVESSWVRGGAHVTAVGSDGVGKQELDPELLRRAEVLVVDSPRAVPHDRRAPARARAGRPSRRAGSARGVRPRGARRRRAAHAVRPDRGGRSGRGRRQRRARERLGGRRRARMTPARGRALAVLLGLGLLAGVEGGLRLAGYKHEVAAVNFRFVGPDVMNMPEYVRDRRLFWRLKPGGPEIGVAAPGQTGASGFRGPAVPKQRRPGAVRVACMGDSTTYGVGMPLEQAYISLLGRSLEYALQRPVEMVNAGCPGYSSYQGLRLLESDVLPLEPDVVTLLFGAWNDFTPAIGGDDEAKGSRWRLPAWTDRVVAGVRDQRLFMLVAHGHERLLGSAPDPRFGQRRLDEYLKGFSVGRPRRESASRPRSSRPTCGAWWRCPAREASSPCWSRRPSPRRASASTRSSCCIATPCTRWRGWTACR